MSMESRPQGANTGDTDTQGAMPSAITSHPWWRGPGFGAAIVPDTTAKAPIGQSQMHGNASEEGDANKVATATASCDLAPETESCDRTPEIKKLLQLEQPPPLGKPYELDVDGLGSETYKQFLVNVRNLLKIGDISGVPMLPPQTHTDPPPQWLELKLKAKDGKVQKETTVKIRGDNLYVVGFQTQKNLKWYEVSNDKGVQYITGSEFLRFKCDYRSMLREAKLSSITKVPLSKSAFAEAVKALADHTSAGHANTAKAIIVVAQMVSEACRFVRIAQHFTTGFKEGKPSNLEQWMLPCLERRWNFFSSIVLCDNEYVAGEKFLAAATVKDVRSRLGIILDTKITELDEDYDDDEPPLLAC